MTNTRHTFHILPSKKLPYYLCWFVSRTSNESELCRCSVTWLKTVQLGYRAGVACTWSWEGSNNKESFNYLYCTCSSNIYALQHPDSALHELQRCFVIRTRGPSLQFAVLLNPLSNQPSLDLESKTQPAFLWNTEEAVGGWSSLKPGRRLGQTSEEDGSLSDLPMLMRKRGREFNFGFDEGR